MSEIRLTVHLPNDATTNVRPDSNDSIYSFISLTLRANYISGDPDDFLVLDSRKKKVDISNNFARAGFRSGDDIYIQDNGARETVTEPAYEDIGDMPDIQSFHQLGILVLDGSGSMKQEGAGKLSLANHVNRGTREFIDKFKGSSQAVNMSLAVITFDDNAILHTVPTPLKTIDSLADYTPTNGHGGNTNIGKALEMAEELALQHFTGPDNGNIPCLASIIVMSDGLCQAAQHTRNVADRIKKNSFHQQGFLKICTSFFQNTQIAPAKGESAKKLLQEIASTPQLHTVSSDYDQLRAFFIGSMSAIQKYGK